MSQAEFRSERTQTVAALLAQASVRSSARVAYPTTGSSTRSTSGFRACQAAVDDNPLAWQTDSLCAQTDPEAFFPEKGGSTRDAKRICQTCEVKAQCLEYALQNDERFGIWGGLSERERRKLRKQAG